MRAATGIPASFKSGANKEYIATSEERIFEPKIIEEKAVGSEDAVQWIFLVIIRIASSAKTVTYA